MKTYKTGFIGCGNMAAAIIDGIVSNDVLQPGDIYLFDTDKAKLERFTGMQACPSVEALAESADVIFLCVKPGVVPAVLQGIKSGGKCIVSIAAGVKTDKMKRNLNVPAKLMRIMPNTPLMVGKGAVCVQTPNDFSEDEKSFIYSIFRPIGLITEVAAEDMDAVTGVSGSGPAYVYLFVDALARAGEGNGLAYEAALTLATQTFEGACAMLRESGKPPGQLIKEVCSPGGTTIEAMNVFEQRDVRGVIKEAVDACTEKSRQLSK